jgi:hypothetical protein
MLQPETIARGRALCEDARQWLRILAIVEPRDVIDLLPLAEHLDAWRRWAEDLEKELSTP